VAARESTAPPLTSSAAHFIPVPNRARTHPIQVL
jgi:hypothetical protein